MDDPIIAARQNRKMLLERAKDRAKIAKEMAHMTHYSPPAHGPGERSYVSPEEAVAALGMMENHRKIATDLVYRMTEGMPVLQVAREARDAGIDRYDIREMIKRTHRIIEEHRNQQRPILGPSNNGPIKKSFSPIDLVKADRPPAGFAPAPKSTKGGYRARKGNSWLYWYPDGKGVRGVPHSEDHKDVHEAHKTAPKSGKPSKEVHDRFMLVDKKARDAGIRLTSHPTASHTIEDIEKLDSDLDRLIKKRTQEPKNMSPPTGETTEASGEMGDNSELSPESPPEKPMSKAELYEIASAMQINGRSRMTKSKLKAAIEQRQAKQHSELGEVLETLDTAGVDTTDLRSAHKRSMTKESLRFRHAALRSLRYLLTGALMGVLSGSAQGALMGAARGAQNAALYQAHILDAHRALRAELASSPPKREEVSKAGLLLDINTGRVFLGSDRLQKADSYKVPAGARGNARKVLEWKRKHGSEVKGMTPVGWARARQLASQATIGMDTVKRMSAFNRHRKNSAIAPEHKDTPWKDAGYVAWLGWGGTTGVDWARRITGALNKATIPELSLAKGAGHKYLKRIATGNPKRPWKYVYKVQHGGGVFNTEHMVVGAKFSASGGHYHVAAKRGDSLLIRHDETGETRSVTKEQLHKLLVREHTAAIVAHKEKMRSRLEKYKPGSYWHKRVSRQLAVWDKLPLEQRAQGWRDPKDVLDSAQFKDWFGDWKSGEGSRVVDAVGAPEEQFGAKPVKMFHGTAVGGFSAFSKEKDKGQNIFGKGFYFTADQEIATEYTKKDEKDSIYSATGWVGKDGKPITTLSREQMLEVIKTSGFSPDEDAGKNGWTYEVDPAAEYAGMSRAHPELKPHGNHDPNVVYAAAKASDKDGNVDLAKFLKLFWTPEQADLDAYSGSFSGIKDHASTPDGVSYSWAYKGLQKVMEEQGASPVIPDSQIFEVYLNIRKPVDMDAPIPREQFDSFARATIKAQIDRTTNMVKLSKRNLAEAESKLENYEWENKWAFEGATSDDRGEAAPGKVLIYPGGRRIQVDRSEIPALAAKDKENDRQWYERKVEEVQMGLDNYQSELSDLNAALAAKSPKVTGLWMDDVDDTSAHAAPKGIDDFLRVKRVLRPRRKQERDDATGEWKTLDTPAHGILHFTDADTLSWGDLHWMMSNAHRDGSIRNTFTEWAKSEGYDGIKHTGGWNIGAKPHDVWIAFEPNQIKATNAKEFSDSDNIYKATIPELSLAKSGGPFVGPRGGKWADAAHTIPYKGDVKDPLFHSTPAHHVEAIQAGGLSPRQGGKTFNHGVYGDHGQGKVFLAAHHDAASHWHEKVENQLFHQNDDESKHRAVTLRVKNMPTKRDEIGDKDVPGSRYVEHTIPPEALEYHDKTHGWRPLAEWSEGRATHPTSAQANHAGTEADRIVASRKREEARRSESKTRSRDRLKERAQKVAARKREWQTKTVAEREAEAAKLKATRSPIPGVNMLQVNANQEVLGVDRNGKVLAKSAGPFIGPKGGKWADAKHTIHWDEDKHGKRAKAAKEKTKPASKAPGSQLPPAVLAKLKALGCSKLPDAKIPLSKITVGDMDGPKQHTHALIKFRDGKGKIQSGYSAEFHRRNEAAKWAIVEQHARNLKKYQRKTVTALAKSEPGSIQHQAALVVSVIAKTGLRPGSEKSLKDHGRYGVTTIMADQVKIRGSKVEIEYVGKSGKKNTATINSKAVAEAFQGYIDQSNGGRLFSPASLRAAAKEAKSEYDLKLKDFRTLVGTERAEKALKSRTEPPPPLTGNANKDRKLLQRALKEVSAIVAQHLNNTPAVARSSYIHPGVFDKWALGTVRANPDLWERSK